MQYFRRWTTANGTIPNSGRDGKFRTRNFHVQTQPLDHRRSNSGRHSFSQIVTSPMQNINLWGYCGQNSGTPYFWKYQRSHLINVSVLSLLYSLVPNRRAHVSIGRWITTTVEDSSASPLTLLSDLFMVDSCDRMEYQWSWQLVFYRWILQQWTIQ